MQKKEVRHMIYTVTFNPCLDYIVGVEDFQLGMTNRTCSGADVCRWKGDQRLYRSEKSRH